MFLPALLIGTSLCAAVSAAPAEAADKQLPVRISVHSACTSEETWLPETPTTHYIQSRIETSRNGESEAMQSLIRALSTRDHSKGLHAKLVSSYWIARTLYDMKLVHLAHAAFIELVRQPAAIDKFPDALSIRAASMECLGRIHHDYPTLALSPEVVPSVARYASASQLTTAQRRFFFDGLTWELIRKLKSTAQISDADYRALLAPLSQSSYHKKLAAILRASQRQDDKGIISNESIFSDPAFGDRPQSEKDLLQTAFGHAFYDLKQWPRAIAHFKQIPNTSNWIVPSLSDLAWTYLHQHRYEESLGSSSNLILGALKKTYAPEGFETLAISYFETCNYREALQTYNYFRKVYGKSFHFLADIQKSKPSLYPKLTSYLSKNDAHVPERVGSEWSRDPLFIADQSEINLGFDEQDVLGRLQRWVKDSPPIARSAVWRRFAPSVTAQLAKNRARKDELTRDIESELMARSQSMFATLNSTVGNLEAMTAEAYEAFGDTLLAENGPGAVTGTRPAPNPRASHRPSSGAVWDWGRYPAKAGSPTADDEDTTETWEDEVGFLKAKVKNHCK
jgi:tetratricopeptide (TPR) repeat protein